LLNPELIECASLGSQVLAPIIAVRAAIRQTSAGAANRSPSGSKQWRIGGSSTILSWAVIERGKSIRFEVRSSLIRRAMLPIQKTTLFVDRRTQADGMSC
jgi:hypothetical protein